jgi:minor fimbrial subunit
MFKRVFMLNMLLSALAVLPGTKAQATDVTITGKVIASSCTVSPVLAAGQTVDLGTLGRTHFQAANDAGTWTSFALNLTNCPAGTTSVKATFTGTPDGTNSNLYANTEPAATAAPNMAVQMADDANRSTVLSTGSVMSVTVDTLTGTATFPLAARLYTPTGGAQAGQVSSSVLVNFTYQ